MISVRQAGDLPPHSFRFAFTDDTLGLGYTLPAVGRVWAFHPLDCAHAGRNRVGGHSLIEWPTSQSSSPQEFHQKALTEPYVNLSIHTALIIHLMASIREPNVQTFWVLFLRGLSTIPLPVFDAP